MKKLFNLTGYSSELETKDRFTYIINSLSIGLVLLFLVFYIGWVKEPAVILVSFLCIADLIVVFIFLKKKKFSTAKALMILGFMFQEFSLVFLWFPKEANFNYFFFLVAPIAFFLYDFNILKERIAIIITNIIALVMIVMSEIIVIIPPVVEISPLMSKFFTTLILISTIGSISIVFYFYANNLASIHKELQLLANTDVLTKVYNRRTLYKEGEAIFNLSRKYKRDFGFIIFDIDFFKSINDSYGHPAGDSVLIQMTELISANIRQHDILARYGGEEFGLLLRDSTKEGYIRAAEHLKGLVENHSFIISDKIKEQLTISIGVVNFSEEYECFDEMVQHADKALYKAKETGRNKVIAV